MATGEVKKVMMVCVAQNVEAKYVPDLQAEGYLVLVHPTANDAPEKAAAYKPGVVVLGVELVPPTTDRKTLMQDIRSKCVQAGAEKPHIIDLEGETLLKSNTEAGTTLGADPSDVVFGESVARKSLISLIKDLLG